MGGLDPLQLGKNRFGNGDRLEKEVSPVRVSTSLGWENQKRVWELHDSKVGCWRALTGKEGMAIISESVTRKINRSQLLTSRLYPSGALELATGPIPELETKRGYLFRNSLAKAVADSNWYCKESSWITGFGELGVRPDKENAGNFKVSLASFTNFQRNNS